MAANRRPAASERHGGRHEGVEPLELVVRPNPQGLERPRRRIDPLPSAAHRRRTTEASAPVVTSGEAARSARDRAGDAPGMPFFPEAEDHVSERVLVDIGEQRGERPAAVGSMRMSSGPSCRKLIHGPPHRVGATRRRSRPRSRPRSTGRGSASTRASSRKSACTKRPARHDRRNARGQASSASGSRSMPMTRPAPASSSAAGVAAIPDRRVHVRARGRPGCRAVTTSVARTGACTRQMPASASARASSSAKRFALEFR